MNVSLIVPVVSSSVLLTALVFFLMIFRHFPQRLPLSLFGFGAAATTYSLFNALSVYALAQGDLKTGLFWNFLQILSVCWVLPSLPQLALLMSQRPHKRLLIGLSLVATVVTLVLTVGFFLFPTFFAAPDTARNILAPPGTRDFGIVRTGPGVTLCMGIVGMSTLALLLFYVGHMFRPGSFKKNFPMFLCMVPIFVLGCDEVQNAFSGTFLIFPQYEFSRYSLGAAIFTLCLLLVLFWRILREAREKVFTENQLDALREEWNKAPFFDPLTDLPNRKSLDSRFDEILARAKREGEILGFFQIGIDHLKAVNDNLGHEAGDAAILHTAQVIKELIRANDVLFRMDGDELAVIITSLKDPSDAGVVAQKIMGAMQSPWVFGGKNLYQTISMGIALFPQDGDEKFKLIREADLALDQAKKDRNTFRFFSKDLNDQAQNKVLLLQELREALENNRYEVHYQPLVNAQGKVAGAEALLRVNLPVSGRVSPDVFIPLAETSGLINAIGQWVMEQVLKDNQLIEAAGHEVYLSVNLSAKQLQDPQFLQKLETALKQSGVNPQKIHLEITETAFMEKGLQSMEILHTLHKRGIPLVLDDFGVGYSSLSYLKNLPVHTLKIDKSFIQSLPHNKREAALVRSIIEMAQGLDLRVVAEGVESLEQKDFLLKHHVNFIQGYYYSKALPLGDFLDYLHHFGSQRP